MAGILELIGGKADKKDGEPSNAMPETDDAGGDEEQLATELFAAIDAKDPAGVVEAIRAIAAG